MALQQEVGNKWMPGAETVKWHRVAALADRHAANGLDFAANLVESPVKSSQIWKSERSIILDV